MDKNPLFSLNVCGTSAPLKESSDSAVFPFDEPQSLIALYEKATKGPSSKFTKYTSQKSLSIEINDDKSIEWEHSLGEVLAGNTSPNYVFWKFSTLVPITMNGYTVLRV